jgi:predicted deacylase
VAHVSERIPLPSASLGTERSLLVHRFGEPGARPKAYMHAALHAAELPGIVVLDHLIDRLHEADDAGRVTGEVVVVPYANPIGLAQQLMMEAQGRYDFDTNRNFNRGFPNLTDGVAERIAGRLTLDGVANVALVRQAMAETLAERRDTREPEVLKATLLGLSLDADIVLDLHSAWEALLHVFVTDVNWPAGEALARQMGSEVTLIDRGNRMMTFKSAHALVWKELSRRFGDRPLPPGSLAAVVELRGQRDVDDGLTRPDADNLFRYLQRAGIVAGRPGPLPQPLASPRTTMGLRRLLAETGGIVVYHRELGDRIRKGETFCHIVDPDSRTRTAVAAPCDGLLYARKSHRFARRGQYFCAIAGDTFLQEPQR